eukprot:TRINITY_DN999_c0_g1_i2.p1 TRINITY_DN999_c0_g1~~TRINITY_DN999_c0_g1_i2.p1  ORF type:complete len:242 (+),score=21.84 TRINITY_DN999_c0_g1_i2:1252-1977(+)
MCCWPEKKQLKFKLFLAIAVGLFNIVADIIFLVMMDHEMWNEMFGHAWIGVMTVNGCLNIGAVVTRILCMNVFLTDDDLDKAISPPNMLRHDAFILGFDIAIFLISIPRIILIVSYKGYIAAPQMLSIAGIAISWIIIVFSGTMLFCCVKANRSPCLNSICAFFGYTIPSPKTGRIEELKSHSGKSSASTSPATGPKNDNNNNGKTKSNETTPKTKPLNHKTKLVPKEQKKDSKMSGVTII